VQGPLPVAGDEPAAWSRSNTTRKLRAKNSSVSAPSASRWPSPKDSLRAAWTGLTKPSASFPTCRRPSSSSRVMCTSW
jgi:hypothetical protein